MKQALRLSKYEYVAVAFYVTLIPLVLVFAPNMLDYHSTYEHQGLVITIIFCSVLLPVVWRLSKQKKLDIHLKHIFMAFFLAVVFAFPEEILFRGIIQSWLQSQLTNTPIVILMSSLIFGATHLPNGIKSYSLRSWNWKLSTLAFLAGLPLGLLFTLTGSLLFPTILHVMFVVILQLLILPFAQQDLSLRSETA